jgi:hypothetical protein
MRFSQVSICRAILAVAAACSSVSSQPSLAQQAAQASTDAVGTIKSETRLVLVDTVVTDKKGNYVRDLTAKDFKVWEDNKEQAVTSFSLEDERASGATVQKR